MTMTSHHRFLLLACLVLVTSSVTSSDHVTWQPSKWLRDYESPIDSVKMEKIVESVKTEVREEMNSALDKMRSDFEQQILTCKNNFNNKNKNSMENFELKMNDTKDYMTFVLNFTAVNAKLMETKTVKINEDLLRKSLALQNFTAKVDSMHKNFSEKLENFDNIYTQIKHQSDSRYQQLTQDINTLTETQNSYKLESQNALSTLQTMTDKLINDRKQETALALERIKSDIASLTSKTSSNSRNITTLQDSMDPIAIKLQKALLSNQLTKLGDRHYFGKDKVSWYEAQKNCRSFGLELASLETEEESRLVVDHWLKNRKDQGSPVWIGGTDEDSEGRWTWSGTGRPVTFTNWYSSITRGEPNSSGQPNGGTSQNCMYICGNRDNEHKGKWCDYSCSYPPHPYICEAKVF